MMKIILVDQERAKALVKNLVRWRKEVDTQCKEARCTNLGKCVKTMVLLSGGILSFSALNFSNSCRLITEKTDLKRALPNTAVGSYFCKLSQKTGT